MCVQNCPQYYIINDDQCINCKDMNQFYYNGNCINSCPIGTYIDYSQNFCIDINDNENQCLNGGIFFNGKCDCGDNNSYLGDICQYKSNSINDIIKSYGNLFINLRKYTYFY